MKATLVLRGGPRFPDVKRARELGLTRFIWEAEDPQLNTALLEWARTSGFAVGAMRVPNWHNDSPAVLAKKQHDDLNRLGYGNLPFTVQADIEYHDPDYVLAWLKAWRTLRPTRATEWTLEPFQGGWFTTELVNAINADPNLVVIPQAYFGDMTPVDVDQVKCDILQRGVNVARVKAYYPKIPKNGFWDGVAWDFLKLPVV